MIRILCIDDEPAILDLERQFLGREPDFQIYSALSAAEGYSLLVSNPIDIIVVDLNMPEIDGLSFLRTIRNEGWNQPVIILTCRTREEAIIEAFENGAHFFIQKGEDVKSLFYELKFKILRAYQLKKAEDEEREANRRYKRLFEGMTEGVVLTRCSGKIRKTLILEIIEVNHAFELLVGMKSRVCTGKNLLSLIPELNDVFSSHLPDVLLSGIPYKGDMYLPSLGRYIWYAIIADKGNAVTVILTDQTEEKEAEKARIRSEMKYRRLMDSAREGIWIIDGEGLTSYVNPSLALMLGYLPDEMVGRFLTEFMPEESVSTARERLENRKAGISEIHEFVFRRKDGSLMETLLGTSPLFSEEGIFKGAIAFVSDITEKKQLLRKLSVKEAQILDLTENAQDIIFYLRLTPSPSFEYINKAVREIVGYEPDEFYHDFGILSEIILEPYYLKFLEAIKNPNSYKDTLKLQCRHKDGRILWLEFRIHPSSLSGEENDALQGMVRDITRIREDEELILRSQAVLNEAQYLSHIGNFEYDLATGEGEWSEEMYRITGLHYGDTLVTIETFPQLIHEEDREEVRPMIEDLIRYGGGMETSCRIALKNNENRWIWLKCQVGQSSRGSGMRLFGIIQDITEKVELDQFKQQTLDQIKQNLEQMAILNDEIRNPLSVIMGLVELDTPPHSDQILKQARVIDELINDLDRGWLKSLKVSDFLRKHYYE